ncbi:hypothetical protein [Nannocystis pusilla]|uniref:hypothetical protein n=1 Tax=Nannocystis pusilla TaxID=889268 RepID=UPI003B767516
MPGASHGPAPGRKRSRGRPLGRRPWYPRRRGVHDVLPPPRPPRARAVPRARPARPRRRAADRLPAEEEALYKNERATALPAKEKPAGVKFAREGCFNDPAKCKCQSSDAGQSQFCGTMLGHFCPDSTLRYLAAACMDLFGGATLCQCAAKQQIEAHIKAEDAAKAKADKEAAKKAAKQKKKAK